MANIKLKWKIIFGFVVIFAIMTSCVLLFLDSMTHRLYMEHLHKGRLITHHIAANAVDPLLTGKPLKLVEIFDNAKSSDRDLIYVFLVDKEGNIAAHNFIEGFPDDLKRALETGGPNSLRDRDFLTEKGKLRTLMAPVLGGELGTVHTGYLMSALEDEMRHTKVRFFAIIIAIFLLGVLAAQLIVRFITKSIVELEYAVEHYGKGDFSYTLSTSSDDEIGSFGVTLNAMAKKLDRLVKMERNMLHAQKLESLGTMAGGIAHDFNNLLMSILGNADIAIQQLPKDSPVLPYLQRIDKVAQRAANLTNQMLAYSGKGKFVTERIDLNDHLREMESLLGTVISKQAALHFELAESLLPIVADATQISQVVMNLVTNASDALGARPGDITVKTGVLRPDTAFLAKSIHDGVKPLEPIVYVSVTDNSCGMTGDMKEVIFDPFYTTKDSGHGLAAVLGIVKSHDGLLMVESLPEMGSTFLAGFPAWGEIQEEKAEEEVPEAAPQVDKSGKMTILLVDDVPDVVEVTKSMLTFKGFEVITAHDGVEAVEAFMGNRDVIAAVVMDITMPRMGGIEAMELMHKIDAKVPVILCSGFTNEELGEKTRSKGASCFIQKPYRTKVLIEKLAEVTAGR